MPEWDPIKMLELNTRDEPTSVAVGIPNVDFGVGMMHKTQTAQSRIHLQSFPNVNS